MPFTPAHSAAVVPLYFTFCKHLVFSALIIGSMSPDFEYILRLTPTSRIGHTFHGLFLFCLPVGLILNLLYNVARTNCLLILINNGIILYSRYENKIQA